MPQNIDDVIAKAFCGGKTFHIAFGGEGIGYYLYVYSGEQCTHDYLQDTMQGAKEHASKLFGVPIESWANVPDKQ